MRRAPLRAAGSALEGGRDAGRPDPSPAEVLWKERRYGPCSVCGENCRLIYHHVVDRQTVRRVGGDEWDPRNALPVGAPLLWGGCRAQCHANHHLGARDDSRIPFALVPAPAVAFARELLGDGAAAVYFAAHYGAPEP